MINNNLKMISQMRNPFSYEEYVALCKENNIYAGDLNKFCLGMGTLAVAKLKYPRMALQEAYSKTFQDMNKQREFVEVAKAVDATKDSCCKKNERKKVPSLLQRSLNLARATSEHIISGMKHVEPATYIKRLNICKGCTSRREGFICIECGCYMGIKASWAEQKCKLNKW